MRLDHSTPVLKMPVDLFERYKQGVAGPEGSLDDSRKQIRNGLIVMIGFFVILLGWAALAPLSGAAVANGVVTVAGSRQTLQSQNGGVIQQVAVREGQVVTAGQVLVRMNSLSTGTGLRQSQAQRDALAATQARLAAERDGASAVAWPADFASRTGDSSVTEAMASQSALFESRRRGFETDRLTEQAQITDARLAVTGPTDQLRFVDDRVIGMRELYAKGFAPKSVLYELEAAKVDLETQIQRARVNLQSATLAGRRAEETRRAAVLDELRIAQTQLQQIAPALDTARFAADRDIVRAPLDGAVVDLASFAPGTILSPGQKLMDILPAGRALIVEARLKPEDVDDVRVGAMADVRFTSVNPRGMSKIEGRVTTLSADRLTDPQTGVAYYLAYIALDAGQVADSGMQLSAGLPASVNVRTQKRSFLNYLLSPFSDSLAKAGREE